MSRQTTPRTLAALAALALAAVAALAGAAPLGAQWTRESSVVVGQMEHRVDAGFGIGASTGTVLGLGGRFVGWRSVEVAVHALGGRLDADDVARDDRTMGELAARASVLPLPWLAIGASATTRTFDTEPAVQRWTTLGAGAELRLAFADSVVRTVVRTTLLPYVGVSGQAGPDMAIATGAGLQFEHRRLRAGLEYVLERYLFPSDPLVGERREQISGLLVRIGARW